MLYSYDRQLGIIYMHYHIDMITNDIWWTSQWHWWEQVSDMHIVKTNMHIVKTNGGGANHQPTGYWHVRASVEPLPRPQIQFNKCLGKGTYHDMLLKFCHWWWNNTMWIKYMLYNTCRCFPFKVIYHVYGKEYHEYISLSFKELLTSFRFPQNVSYLLN